MEAISHIVYEVAEHDTGETVGVIAHAGGLEISAIYALDEIGVPLVKPSIGVDLVPLYAENI